MNTKAASFVLFGCVIGLLSANAALAADDAAVQEIDAKASNANSKADNNQGRIGTLEAQHRSLRMRSRDGRSCACRVWMDRR